MEMTYKGINRKLYPDWFGWVIIDLLIAKPHESKQHKDEIKRQLKYELDEHNRNFKPGF